MNIEKIKNAKTNFLEEIIYKEQINSTQDFAKEIVKNEDCKLEKFLVITNNQLQGKGTKENIWFSSEGKNITMTLAIKDNMDITVLENLTIKIAEQIKDAIKELYGYELEIKYPNDLLLNGKKICGILTETSIVANKVNYILIGIGFNVNEENFNEETKNIATSLKKEFGKDFDIEYIIIKILEKLEDIFKAE